MPKKRTTTCILCHKRSSTTLDGIKEYLYCRNCRIGWLKEYANITYDDTYYEGTSGTAGKLFSPIQSFFYSIRNSFAHKKNIKLWIDVGAGDGQYLQSVHAKRRIGVEISTSGRRIMKEHGLETMTDASFLKAKNLQADIISFWQVLEHVDKPLDYLIAAQRNLKANGKIIVAVPNHESFEFRSFGKYWFHLVPQFHIWHFSGHSLRLLLKEANLHVDSADYWAIEHHFTGVLQSFINRSAKSDSVLHRIIKRRQDFSSLSFTDIFWVVFWCTIGLPIVICFWIAGAVAKKSGTFVFVTSKIKN
jgi:2-polyprenyl-3-methyl-5-hydroxy-6-metoxy-1,4-benzoquinol methylase